MECCFDETLHKKCFFDFSYVRDMLLFLEAWFFKTNRCQIIERVSLWRQNSNANCCGRWLQIGGLIIWFLWICLCMYIYANWYLRVRLGKEQQKYKFLLLHFGLSFPQLKLFSWRKIQTPIHAWVFFPRLYCHWETSRWMRVKAILIKPFCVFFERFIVYFCGGVAERPETMCPCTNILGPLVPKLIVPGDTMFLHWYIPVIMKHTLWIGWCKNGRHVSMQGPCVSGTIHLGDQWSQNIRSGTVRFGTYHHPTIVVTPYRKRAVTRRFASMVLIAAQGSDTQGAWLGYELGTCDAAEFHANQ